MNDELRRPGPAELLGAAVLNAWRAVLPSDTQLVPVGGLTPEKLASFVSAGASGAGLGDLCPNR